MPPKIIGMMAERSECEISKLIGVCLEICEYSSEAPHN